VHDVHVAAKLGFLGSVDCNSGSEDLGWDTDEFIFNAENATELMLAIVQQGGLAPGGLNFDCKVRRESTSVEDLFWGHVAGMDQLALGLRNAVKIVQEGIIPRMVKHRYRGFDEGFGAQIESGKATFEDCDEYVRATKKGANPQMESSQEEKFKLIFARTISARL